ncbi:DNA repair helicase [Phanerochaete sordida]|uniref:ATP-dependent DNA helicase CHL1 n=1 Tax=Phanerochaete sordida TaxID=48140 RepID=A0A9P3LHZ3_9APHY|nr:DNA repair helicase [Phanerochaete sordida]
MTLNLPTPSSFPAFPFTPYDIQLGLMRHLYENIENRRVTVVESPTGTGKTLSLLCASLTWLRDEQDRARKGKISADEEQEVMDWVLAQTLERKRRQLEAEEMEYAERLAEARKREAVMRRAAKGRVRKRMKAEAEKENVGRIDFEDSAFLPDSIDGAAQQDEDDNISPAVRALMQKLEKSKAATSSSTTEAEPTCTKIYYTSRTHSQLAQVLHELRKLNISLSPSSVVSFHRDTDGTAAPSSSCTDPSRKRGLEGDEDEDEPPAVDVRTVSLASRKQLCVNEKLKGKKTDLDEACRQLLSEKGEKRCPYLPPADEETRMLDLRDQILATPKDIESLVQTAQESRTCPYFGSRRAIAQAQLVLLPYNLLLQKTAREAMGIDLTGQVIVVDEAHNLVSTLLALSTVALPLRTLATALAQLSIYLDKFRTRLSTAHALHLRRLVALLEALVRFAEEWRAGGTSAASAPGPEKAASRKPREPGAEVLTSGELMGRLGRRVAGVNLLEIETYLRASKVARKIAGYCAQAMEKAAGQDPKKLAKLARLGAATPPLHVVENFIVALTAASDDGRVTLSIVNGEVEIKYQHLNPATYFQEVVETARAVVLAGGTMSPISDVTNQLFPFVPAERLTTFSCGHIVPPASLQTLVVKKGPKGSAMQFKFDSRNDQNLMAELGQVLFNFASLVPAGMVVFVPSYGFLNTVMGVWEKSGLLERLRSKKKVFTEPQESSDVETVLREYAAEVHSARTSADGPKKRGALLFAVVGAKLSEGLNFADDLARAVVIVGLPFANLASPELRERMAYVNRAQQRRGGAPAQGAKDAGTELYENMCMKAVNQSIGRAIRHRGDWASLVLLDARYAAPRIQNKLPKWIGRNVAVAETFGEAVREMGRFYRERRAAA